MNTANMTPMNPERNPVVFTKDGEVFANSRDVASFFEKRHADVLRSIETLNCSKQFAQRNFAFSTYEDSTGRSLRMCDMTKDGFSFLAMGFTGGKAGSFKERYIEQFNAMEAELRRIVTSGPVIDLNDPGALRGLLLTYSEKAMELEKQVRELLPSQDALHRISQAEGSLCITDAAKALQMRPSDIFNWLRQNGWIYKRLGSSHDLGYSSKTQAGLLEHKVTTVTRADGSEKVTEQVRVTAKGLTKLAMLINRPEIGLGKGA